MAAWIVPAPARPIWREKRRTEFAAWQHLTARGEIVNLRTEVLDYVRFVVRSALSHRLADGEAERLLRSVGALALTAAIFVAGLAAISKGFAGTVAFATELMHDGLTEMVFGLTAPIVLALTAGLIVALLNLPSLHLGWKYLLLLLAKLTFLAVVSPVLLIEVTAILRPYLPRDTGRWFVVGIGIRAAFVALHLFAVYQAVIDQRRRCPVCLRRLALPVSVGCWGSSLEPPATEIVCEHGHGSMCVREDAGAESDLWIRLDPSWRDLFINSPR